MSMKNKKLSLPGLILSAALCMAYLLVPDPNLLLAQGGKGITVSGKVYNSANGKPVDMVTVVFVEARLKTYTDRSGSYSIVLPGPGNYTVRLLSSDLQSRSLKLDVKGDRTQNFYLQPLTVKGAGLTIEGERDIQKVGRHTMTKKNLKEVPGSFGDSVNALTSLPGVIRTNGFFGPLVIRGGNFLANKYFIDDIPVYNPMHFGGIHSVINNNLIREIDLYASAFPAQYGSANSAIIDINTVDSVKEFGGYTDVGLISASALIQAPILKDKTGQVHFASPYYVPEEQKDMQNAGYVIASGRVGYLSIFIPYIVKAITGEKPSVVPQYWDYQTKMKYYLNSDHSITLFFMGSHDYLKVLDSSDFIKPDEGDDPLLVGAKFKVNWTSHSQGIYYTFQPSEKFTNRLMAYSALLHYYTYLDIPAEGVADAFKDIRVNSYPYIYGAKDRFKLEVIKKHFDLSGGFEYTYYHFKAKGKTIMNTTQSEDFNLADPNLHTAVPLDITVTNYTLGGYGEMKARWFGFTLVPGVRAEYFKRTGQSIVDPRGMISYELPTETTLSLAGGQYSYFFQTNPFLFSEAPQVTALGKELKPERAIHRLAGIEQKLGLFVVKTEAFYNSFRDLAEGYSHYQPDGTRLDGMSTGQIRAKGFEIMIRKDQRENELGLFGWTNYTYTRSRHKSGLPTEAGLYGITANQVGDPYGDQWTNYQYEQRHAFKTVLGYSFKTQNFRGKHTLSGKFQYYTSTPYTPITGAKRDDQYSLTHPGKERWTASTGYPYSAYFENDHRLDVRYSYTRYYSWGYVSWYVEVLNIYNHVPKNSMKWDYRYPYSDTNPEIKKDTENPIMGIIPNFGVEVKF